MGREAERRRTDGPKKEKTGKNPDDDRQESSSVGRWEVDVVTPS